jgi:glucosyl-3-phosphoglycerate synthase
MNESPVLPVAVGDWLARRSYRADAWDAKHLAARKNGQRISVVIPARDEESTIGAIVDTVRRCLMEQVALVDELIVVDSRSRDRTAERAARVGATVVGQDEVLPAVEPMDGKGDALWKGLAASSGDLVVFVDGDLRDFSAHYVTGLLGPLLDVPGISYVKGFYHRPLERESHVDEDGGGRVTELVARPLLNLYWPQLAGFVQPLAGEYAGRRDVLTRLPFVCHYGVEVGHLVDILALHGLDALAQVDLGVRRHRHQDNHQLGVMAAQIMVTLFDRLVRAGHPRDHSAMLLTQFRRGNSLSCVDRELVLTHLSTMERPPLAALEVSTP